MMMKSRLSQVSGTLLIVLAALTACTVYDYGPGRPPVVVPGVPVAAPPPVYAPAPPPPPPPPPIVRQEVTLRGRGAGAPPSRAANAAQARLMTERAAKVDG